MKKVTPEKLAARDSNRIFEYLKKQKFNCIKIDLAKSSQTEEDDKDHVPVYIIQGTHVAVNGKKFIFQISVSSDTLNKKNKLQVKLSLQHLKTQMLEILPQTYGQLCNLIKLYNYKEKSEKIVLA